MATYRVINPKGDVVDTKDIESAEDAHAWFVDSRADNSELGWRMEVEHDGEWSFFDDSEGSPRLTQARSQPMLRAKATASSEIVPSFFDAWM